MVVNSVISCYINFFGAISDYLQVCLLIFLNTKVAIINETNSTETLILRHYKLEAALAAMTWRIRWEELNGGDRKRKDKESNKKYEETFFFGYPQKNQTNGLMRSESRTSWAKAVGQFLRNIFETILTLINF